jgi:predicted unusual protein kinase regulating ubiquinone biosynthesis (AarF/ABC1/UbiB family)
LFIQIRRALSVLEAVIRFLVLPFFFRKRAETGPVRLRKALESLGGTWIKLGQALALRFDLLPSDYCLELFRLLNRLQPFDVVEVRRVIREELQADPEEIFKSFDPICFAAASIGQVHRAVLHSGEAVAVKIQRPGVDSLIRADIKLMYYSCWLIDATGLLGRTRSRDLIDEFSRWTEDELDYRIEAKHGYYLERNAAGATIEEDAHVFWQYTRRRILTTRFLEGPTIDQVLRALRDRDTGYLNQLAAQGITPPRLARHICWNLLNQVYIEGYFHADLHPANIIALPESRIGYVDFGITGILPDNIRNSLIYYAWNLFENNLFRAVEEIMRWVVPTSATDVGAARRELSLILKDYLLAVQQPSDSPFRAEIPQFEVRMLEVVRQFGMALTPELSMYFKALITASAVIFQLDPSFDLAEVESSFFREMLSGKFRSWFNPDKISSSLFSLQYRSDQLLNSFEQLVESTTEDITSVAEDVRGRIHIYTFVSFALGAMFFLLKTVPIRDLPPIVTRVLPWLVYSIIAAICVFVFGVLRQARRLPPSGSTPSADNIVRRRRPR